MDMKIICSEQSSICAVKLSIIAELAQVKYSYEETSLKSSESLLLTPEGVSLPSSTGMKYLGRLRPDLSLYGRTFIEMALVDKMMKEIENRLLVAVHTAIHTNGLTCEDAAENIENFLIDTVAPQLTKSTFLVGERLSIADVDLAVSLSWSVALNIVPSSIIMKYPSIQRWMNLILNQPTVIKYFRPSEIKPLEKKKETKTGTKTNAMKPNDSEKPEGVKETSDVSKDEEISKKKPTNPLQLLPPTPFILDEWKRQYSNSKQLRETMKWFWEKFDKEGWSLWYVHYDKAEDENKIGYITANLLGGFLQRIEPAFRQYSFGVMNVIGETGNFDINGVLLIRGLELPQEITEHVSFEYYQFRKLSPLTNSKDKELIENYWCNSDVVEGRPIDSCKVWK